MRSICKNINFVKNHFLTDQFLLHPLKYHMLFVFYLNALAKSTLLTKESTINLMPGTEIKCFVSTSIVAGKFTYKVSGKKYLYTAKYSIEYDTHIKYQDIEYKVQDDCEIKLVDFTGKISENNLKDVDLRVGYVNVYGKNNENNLVLLQNKLGEKIEFKKMDETFQIDVDDFLLSSYIEKQSDKNMEINKNWYEVKNDNKNLDLQFRDLILIDVSRLEFYKNKQGKKNAFYNLTTTSISTVTVLKDVELTRIRKAESEESNSSDRTIKDNEISSERYKEKEKSVESDHFEHSRTEHMMSSETDFKDEEK